jgi:hypothetical protein
VEVKAFVARAAAKETKGLQLAESSDGSAIMDLLETLQSTIAAIVRRASLGLISPTTSRRDSFVLAEDGAPAVADEPPKRRRSFSDPLRLGRSRANTMGNLSDAGASRDFWSRLMAATMQEKALLQQLAEHLAVHELSLLKTVKPSELQKLAFAGKQKNENAPNVMMLIAHFNKMSRWVCHQLLKEPNLKDRVRCLRLFISLAKLCQELNNFNGLMEIVAALNSAAIYRLTKTWEALPRKDLKDFKDLDDLVKPQKSHASLRGAMRAARNKPTIPYLGLYLTDLTFIEDGNADFVDGDDGHPHINFAKCQMVGKAILEVMTFQKKAYTVQEEVADLFSYFSLINPPTDNDLFSKSLQCEARAGESSPSPNVAKKWDNVRRGSDHMPNAPSRSASSPGMPKEKSPGLKKAASVAKVAMSFTRSRSNTTNH